MTEITHHYNNDKIKTVTQRGHSNVQYKARTLEHPTANTTKLLK